MRTTPGTPSQAPAIFGAILVMIVAVGLLSSRTGSAGKAAEARDLAADAPFMCQEFVKRRLKAPATAEFPNPYRDGTSTVPLDSSRFRVSSYVDAENAFSAKLRTHYTCTVRKAGGDDWELLALELAERD